MQKTVLITGGAGSLGSAICKELIFDKSIKKVIIFSRDEKHQLSLKWHVGFDKVKYIIGDVKDYNSVYNALIGVDEVYHLAAIKHIDIAEENPIETTNTNIVGTINLINACVQHKVKKMLLVSTDKASAPTGIYGATKLVAEKNVLLSNGTGETKFSVVRFGNLVGSSGSIFQKWAEGGKINLTHADLTRFFIKMEDASRHCIDFMEIMQGNEIFIPKMKSARIYDIAKLFSNDIEVTGLRKNEKIHEDIISSIDFGSMQEYEKYYVIVPDGKYLGINKDSGSNDNWFTEDEIKGFI